MITAPSPLVCIVFDAGGMFTGYHDRIMFEPVNNQRFALPVTGVAVSTIGGSVEFVWHAATEHGAAFQLAEIATPGCPSEWNARLTTAAGVVVDEAASLFPDISDLAFAATLYRSWMTRPEQAVDAISCPVCELTSRSGFCTRDGQIRCEAGCSRWMSILDRGTFRDRFICDACLAGGGW